MDFWERPASQILADLNGNTAAAAAAEHDEDDDETKLSSVCGGGGGRSAYCVLLFLLVGLYTPLDYALMVYYLSLQVHSTGLRTDGVLPLITGKYGFSRDLSPSQAGEQTEMKDKGGRSAGHSAAHKAAHCNQSNGRVRLIKLLLSNGADCHMKDNEGQTAVHLCTRHKSPKCMTLLLRQLSPGEIDDQDRNKRTALHWAASYGNLEHVKMLIKQDSIIGILDIEGKTPLHWAASSRDAEAVNCVRLILDTTPSVINWQDYEGRTALHLVVADGNEAVVKALASTKTRGHSKIVSLLLDNKAEFSSSDQNGATPLHYAAQNNFDETVEVFLSRANVTDEADVEGRTAFMWAAGKGADQVLETFLKHNVDIQQVDKNGGT
ncbi:hypothetical protein DPMN_184325, partial [Dreissena polymorpha]